MPTAPYAEIRASLNGGAVQTGGITATGGQVVQLSANPAGLAGATQYLWEIIDYPPGYATPVGWTLESDGRLTSILQTPPPFTLDANTARWGKYILNLTLNGGGPTLTGRETVAQLTAIAALVDDGTALKVLSPNGQPDIGFGESSQFGGRRGWLFELKATFRIIEALLGGGGGSLDHGALLGLGDDDHGAGVNAYALARRALNPLTGASNDAALADARKFITTSHGSACTLRVRLQSALAWTAADELAGANIGAGTLTITAEGGVTLNGSVTVVTNGWWWAKRTGLNTWQVSTGGSSSGGDIKSDGSVPFAADQSMGSHKLTNVSNGSSAGDAVNFGQLSALVAASIDWKDSVRLATAAAMAASTRVSSVRTANANGALANIDGTAPAVGNRILDKDNATGADRGIWVVTDLGSGGTPWVLTRATDADVDSEVTSGLRVGVTAGATNAGKVFYLSAADPITVNTTTLTFAEDNQSVVADEVTLTKTGSIFSVKPAGIGNTQLATGMSWSKFASAIGDLAFTGLKLLSFTGLVNNGTAAIDFTSGQWQKKTLSSSPTLTVTPPPGPCRVLLQLIQDGTGGRTVTWWVGITWSGGAPPKLQTAAGASDFVELIWDGSAWWGVGKIPLEALQPASAKGATLYFDGTNWQMFGPKFRATDLPDSTATLSATDGAAAYMAPTTLTANRSGQFNTTGAASGSNLTYTIFRRDTTAFTYDVKDSLGATIFSFLGDGQARAATFQFTTEWTFVSQLPIN